eukprot:CAMPEP_0181117100 /NCGR_PEP_ID=MMETSP1071-20121207/22317_1 /TAXON_ID=35127 /ORGANISM="Thalassiosira sp., Strain NH16" /LENGTH=109 /DNA_ID=CAMNT_0023201415 /DNA_START=95 /DNA_END=424 /DNA_ORIENTATION=-
MSSTHTHFAPTERSLQNRVSRLESEKDALVSNFNDALRRKDEEHALTRIEMSAYKLEMQNALNDIDSLKKENDDLKARIAAYAASLEAACVGKGEIEERMHSLGIVGGR